MIELGIVTMTCCCAAAVRGHNAGQVVSHSGSGCKFGWQAWRTGDNELELSPSILKAQSHVQHQPATFKFGLQVSVFDWAEMDDAGDIPGQKESTLT